MSNGRLFVFRQKGVFSPTWTFVWILITIYFLWRITQALTGDLPVWLAPVPVLAIVYMWTMRLKPVRAILVENDGNVVFQRHWGRREVNAIYVKRVRPWFNVSWPGNYVLTHAEGWELLFEDRERAAEIVRELLRFNPEIDVRGLPLPPGGAVDHVA